MTLRIEKADGWTKFVVRDKNDPKNFISKDMNGIEVRQLISLLETAAKSEKFLIETSWD